MKTFRFLVAGLLAIALAGCGDPDNVKEIKTGADGGRGKYDIYSGVGGGKQEQGSLFGPGGLFGSKNTKKDGEGLRGLPTAKLESGNSEIRNWIAAAGAAEHLPMHVVDYVPCYRSEAGSGVGMAFAVWQ